MNKRIARFEKVSYKQFVRDWQNNFNNYTLSQIEKIYNDLILPTRATTGSAGYDFYLPTDFKLEPHTTIIIPTGIRVKMNIDYVLQIYPRSSLGYKYRLQLDNTIGIIDSDYYYAENEGHIFIKLTYLGHLLDQNNPVLNLTKGQAFIQGVFLQYGLTEDDNVTINRHGGIGSTSQDL